MSKILVPNPLPAPSPVLAGQQDSYQYKFNAAYCKSRPSWFAGFYIGESHFQSGLGTPLTQEQVVGKAKYFFEHHIDFDQQIEYFQWDPYVVMYMRQVVYGYERVPVGTGHYSPDPPVVVNPADLKGPAVKGKWLRVSCDINDYPPVKV